MNPPDKFIITETEPTPLIHDFQSFLEYIGTNKPYLTPKGYVSGKDLFEINKGMTHPIGDTTVRSGQQLYPQLHLFFHLAQAGRLIQKALGKADKTVLQLSDQAMDYSELTPTEKYFFLLETLWVDTNWKHVEASIFKGLGILDAQTVLGKLAGRTPNVRICAKDLVSVPDSLGYLWIYFPILVSGRSHRIKRSPQLLNDLSIREWSLPSLWVSPWPNSSSESETS